MKICCISDLHGHLPPIEPCDLLLVAGDVCPLTDHDPVFQTKWLRSVFAPWLSQVPAKRSIWTAGNHDFALENPALRDELNCRVDVAETIFDLKIWCSPWSVRFGTWAFMEDEPELFRKFAAIPTGTDIIVSHVPPFGYGDRMITGNRVGSTALATRIEQLKPQLVVFGHIHEGHGPYQLGPTRLINAAICNEANQPVHLPTYVELEI
jgi:predicted phosphodiesterase